MKKVKFFVMCAMAVSIASCTNVAEQEESLKFSDIVINATQEGQITRTSVDETNGNVFWGPGEAIKVFSGSSSAKFISQNTQKAVSSVFVCNPGSPVKGQPKDVIYGLYPYDSNATFSNGAITTSLSNTQAAVEGSFADNLYVSAGKATVKDPSIKFYNLCGGLRFKVTEAGMTTVKFKGNSNENLTGKFTISFDSNNNPVLGTVTDAGKEIVLNCAGGFKTGVWYYIVMLPVQLTNGFTMTFESASKGAQEKVLNVTSSKAVKRSVFGQKDNIDYGLTWKAKTGYIDFADDIFRAFCLANFDTDHDGGITPSEAAAVTVMDIKNVSGTIRSLGGIENFVNLTSLSLSQCNLGTMNLSMNTKLQTLNCANSGLTALNLSANTALKSLNCSGNSISTLDLQSNLSLTELICNNNSQLKEIWLKAGQSFDTLTYDTQVATLKYKVDDGGSEGVAFENW